MIPTTERLALALEQANAPKAMITAARHFLLHNLDRIPDAAFSNGT